MNNENFMLNTKIVNASFKKEAQSEEIYTLSNMLSDYLDNYNKKIRLINSKCKVDIIRNLKNKKIKSNNLDIPKEYPNEEITLINFNDNNEKTNEEEITLINFNDNNELLKVPITYIQHSKTLSNLLQDINEKTIKLPNNFNFLRADIDFIFNNVIKLIENLPLPKEKDRNIENACCDAVKDKSFYKTMRLLQSINYFDISIDNKSLVDIFCNLLRTKKIKYEEIEKCEKLGIQSSILSKIGSIGSSFKIDTNKIDANLLFRSDLLRISNRASLNIAVNEDCSKIAVVGFSDEKNNDEYNPWHDDPLAKIPDERLYVFKEIKSEANKYEIIDTYCGYFYLDGFSPFVNLTFFTNFKKDKPLDKPLLEYKDKPLDKPLLEYLAYAQDSMKLLFDSHNEDKDYIMKYVNRDTSLIFHKKKKLMASCNFRERSYYTIENFIDNTEIKIELPFQSTDKFSENRFRQKNKFKDEFLNINACFDKNGDKIAMPSFKACSKDDTKHCFYGLSIYTIANKKLINIRCHPYVIQCLTLSNDGKFVAAQIKNRIRYDKYRVFLWDTETGYCLKELGGTERLIQIMFTPQDNFLLMVPEQGSIEFVNIFTKEIVNTDLTPFYKNPTYTQIFMTPPVYNKNFPFCTRCISLEEKNNEVLLYGIFQDKNSQQRCYVELYTLSLDLKNTNPFFSLLHKKQEMKSEFDEQSNKIQEIKEIQEMLN